MVTAQKIMEVVATIPFLQKISVEVTPMIHSQPYQDQIHSLIGPQVLADQNQVHSLPGPQVLVDQNQVHFLPGPQVLADQNQVHSLPGQDQDLTDQALILSLPDLDLDQDLPDQAQVHSLP